MFNNRKIELILKNQEKMMKDIQNIKNSISSLKKEQKIVEINTTDKIYDEFDEPAPKKIGRPKKSTKKVGIPKKSTKKESIPWNMSRQEKLVKNKHLALRGSAKYKDYPIEYELKNKTDMKLTDFARTLGVSPQLLRARLTKLEKAGVTWINNDNFVYYLRKPNTNYLVKILTKPAQDYLIRRYGIGKKAQGRPGRRALA